MVGLVKRALAAKFGQVQRSSRNVFGFNQLQLIVGQSIHVAIGNAVGLFGHHIFKEVAAKAGVAKAAIAGGVGRYDNAFNGLFGRIGEAVPSVGAKAFKDLQQLPRFKVIKNSHGSK